MGAIITGKTFDEERALYHLENTRVENCVFAGEADGESVLKESRNITVADCSFSLRYPLWHARKFTLDNSDMDLLTRAPLWYSEDGVIKNCRINGIKCLRECDGIEITGCRIVSPEFGWRCRGLRIHNSEIESEYLLFEAKDADIKGLEMRGKYSFQYTENFTLSDCVLDTKDAFWHCNNVTVSDSVVKGEYLGWYSNGLTFINCRISGTQPLCYCKNLRLINCTMQDTDLSFEYSDVQADIKGGIMSVKNPASGKIVADGIGEIIREDSVIPTSCEISLR